MKKWAEQFYYSDAWRRTRQAYRESVGGICERCAKRGEIIPAEIVHHRKWLTKENINDPSVTLDWKNLEALCQACHNEEHMSRKTKRQYRVGPDGDILPPIPRPL